MMMKKKFVAVALSAVCLLSAVGCGQQSASTASSASSVSSSVASSASASQVMDAEDYLSGISGTYVELFPEMAKSEYRNLWIDAATPLVGEDNAESATDSGVMMQLSEIFNAMLQLRRMKAIEQEPAQEGATAFQSNGHDICFNHVGFWYQEGEDVLSDVTFTAKQGEVTALVGPSGGGKSTTAKLAARFWDIQKGTITMGGVDISTVDPETLLKDYAIVFQDVVLFNDTIMGNIRLGRKDATDEEVMAAARAAQCDEFVQRLPEGYQTVVGENGSTLSGGERQRISIARALLKNAPIVLLDEATASLDVENETSLQTALSALLKDKTVLVIAHRMRTVMGADHVVVLADGHVAEEGTPEQLMERGGMFRHMVELQRESSNWQVGGNRGGS